MVYIESEVLELKTKFSESICKDIVAFLNSNGGDLIIGVDDNGNVVGINNIDETSKKISDIITDQIEPNPQSLITSEIIYEDGKTLLAVHIKKGTRPIYCQKKYGFSSTGCVIRIGTTCKNMSQEQIQVRYEQNFIDTDRMLLTPARYGTISFKILKVYYAEKGYHLDDASFEANLNLRTPSGEYNQLAELLSDKNMIPVVVAKFQGRDKTSVSEKNDYGNQCLLFTYEQIKNRLVAENICISNTTVRPREDKYLFDFDCVNEAIINALVHNDWNISQPLISLYQDRIEIFSHGGLPKGQTKEMFFRGISRPRNDMLMRIFMNMNLSEHTGHGIPTILAKYGKDVFEIGDSYILVTIPYDKDVIDKLYPNNNVGINVGLNSTEKNTLKILLNNGDETTQELAEDIGVTKRTIERTVKKLQEKGYLTRIGARKTGKWIVIRSN